ncbi:hypothetical protein ACI5KX_01485 [Erythrobacter sp. GH1-10]|uniref:hypothetical protein n=1 Tax=Erythrobacter sp. GH1-10 TaxID=3349334 RepID=UPI003877F115
MTLLSLTIVPLIALYGASDDGVLAGSEYTKAPDQWEVAYDVAIQPYLDDYRRCLGYANRIFNGVPNVEEQHRADLPRCAGERQEAIAQSNAALARWGRAGEMPPSEVERTFDAIGQIHISRGRNLDQQFQLQLRAAEERQRQYEAQIAARDAALATEESE